MDISFMTNLKLFFFICSSFLIFATADNLGLCSDPNCKEFVGLGITTQFYNADESSKLSFQANQEVQIFVKDYGEKKNLLGVKLNGKRGFIPKTFVRETSTKLKQDLLVPAIINFGDTIEKPPDVVNQESQFVNQDVHNQLTDAATNDQSSIQHHQTFQESSFIPTESSGPSENQFMSTLSQAQPPSNEGHFDSQSGGYTHQHPSPYLTNPPQQSLDTSIPSNIQQQFSSIETSYTPQLQSADIYNHQSPYWSDVGNTAQQHYTSDASNTALNVPGLGYNTPNVPGFGNIPPNVPGFGNIPPNVNDFVNTPPNLPDLSNTPHNVPGLGNTHQQYSDTQFPSQNSFIPNAENHMHHNVEQMVSPPFNSPEHQYNQFTSGNSPVQQHFHNLQASFSAHSIGSPSASYFPSSSFSGEINSPGNEVNTPSPNYPQSDSAIPNAAPEVKQSIDSFNIQQNLENTPKEHPINTFNIEKFPEANNLYQDTFKLLESQGYHPSEFNYDDTSSNHPNSAFKSDLFQQNQGNPSFQPSVDKSDGTINQAIHQTDVVDSSIHSTSIEPSFGSSSTQVKADHSAEKTSNIAEQQNSEISEVSPMEENSENDDDLDEDEDEDDGEAEIEEEIDYSDSEVNDKDIQRENSIEIDQKSEKAYNYDNSQSDKSALPSETQSSNAYKSGKKLNVYTTVEDTATIPDKITSQKKFDHPPSKFNEPESPTNEFNESDSFADNLATDRNETTKNSDAEGLIAKMTTDIDLTENATVQMDNENITNIESNPEVFNSSLTLPQDTTSKEEINIIPDIPEERPVEAENLSFNSSKDIFIDRNVTETDHLSKKEPEALDKIMNNLESSKDEEMGHLNPYQIRNLKEDQESKNSENVESSDDMGDNATNHEDDEYDTFENSLEAIRSFIEDILAWIPEPFYSMIMDLEHKGISPKVPVFTALCAVPCILLIIGFVYIKESSKEKFLTVQLAHTEKNVFTLTAEKNALEEKLEKTIAEFESTKSMLEEERRTFDSKKTEVVSLKQLLETANLELESNMDEINTLKEREKDYRELVKDHEKVHCDLMEEKSSIEKKVVDQEDYINKISDQLEEKENEVTSLQAELEKFKQSNKDYEEKLNQLQTNCNQLLKEAEVWNMRVNELNSKLSEESSAKEELRNSLELKDAEVKSLTNLVETFKSFEEIDIDNEDEHKSNEEKLKSLIDSSSLLIKLQKQEEENKVLYDKLSAEKEKVLEMEVGLLESKSEIEKLKFNYNQALQDKTEATTKLEVLTNYFKDKEMMLQKQLGAQEAFRERREKDADSAERQIVLIEQENSSYKSQVASMKQEMEETERNLKTQIATQEKKAHENWIAARAAERKLEDMKQEVTQLRQRLTLLEREQENWVNSSRDDIIRPIPKRISGINDESTNGQDLNNTLDPRHIFHPPPPMLLPLDRPLPPPLPHLPPFLDPPPFRPQPWHHMDPPDFRMTPPDFMGPRSRHPDGDPEFMGPRSRDGDAGRSDFMRGREVTPPRSRPLIDGGDMGPMQSSPLGDMRESRNSTPPHSLPDFHDIPPPPPRFFPMPPGHLPRYPMPPPYRREFAPGQKRTDNQSDNSSMGRGTQPTPSSQENWSHNSRV